MLEALKRAQRRVYPTRIRYSKLGVTGLFSVVMLVLIFAAGALLDLRGDRAEVKQFGEYANANKQSPLESIVAAARSHRFVFLADIHSSTETKRLAAQAIKAISEGPGLDAVVLEVSHDQQAHIDRYFDSTPENASILLSNPLTLREPGAAAREYLEIYHVIWQLNEKLGADRRINVIAVDLDGWPPEPAASPTERARRFAERGEAMVKNLDAESIGMGARARVFAFMTGLHTLRSGSGQLQTGGSTPVVASWFAARLAQRHPGEVYSFVSDAPGAGAPEELVPYTGTRLGVEAESVLPAGRYALKVNPAFDFLSRPIRENAVPGMSFDIMPPGYRLKDVADEYIHLGN
jgi:X-X-X-Leu-X-X-Gly heptad repeat protein